jgi:hypothetical protein
MKLAKIKAKLAAAKRAALEAVKLVDVWIRICPWDSVYHEAINFTVDRTFCANLAAYIDWCATRGHLPPVLRQHDEDGQSYGLVRKIEAREDGPWLLLGLHEDVAAKYERGRLPYWSPHFEWEFPDPHRPSADDPATPHIWPVRLREMSFVSVPHLLNNPPANVALGNTTRSVAVMCAAMPTQGAKNMLTPEDIEALKSALVPAVTDAVMAKLKAEVEVEMADPPKDEPPVAPMSSTEPPKDAATLAALSSSVTRLSSKVTTLEREKATMTAKLAAQEKKAAEAEVAADLAGVELDAAEVKSLVALKLSSDPEARAAYAVAVKGYRAAVSTTVGAEFGATGSAAPVSSPNAKGKIKTAALAAKAKNIEMGADLLKHLREQGIDHSKFTDADWAELDSAYGVSF